MSNNECEFCEWPEGAWFGCLAESAGGYVCSREQGHDGPHVACGTKDHALATWDNDGERERTNEQP